MCHKGTHSKCKCEGGVYTSAMPELSLSCRDDHVISAITGEYESSRGACLAL